ncbi:MAG: amidohydrolase family protein, partial [Planctomycetes bacterium]|nr:amidohydrolase family protein [Planctomycetota bacterium]
MPRRGIVALVACLIVTGAPRLISRAPQAGPALALQNATVVVGNGQVIPGATVIVRGGLIEAVGPKAAVPPGARAVNLQGMYLYPGLIDTLTEKGLVRRKLPQLSEAEQTTDNQALFAGVRAADFIDAASKDLPAWKNAGVLVLNVAPDRGIFMGQTAVISLNGGTPDEMIVRPSVAMRVAFQGLGYRNRRRGQGEPGGVYPTRLIGVQAFIRQTLLDARYYDDSLKAYQTNARGLARPETNHTLEALLPVARRAMPVIIPADEQREIQRIVDLSDETKVSAIISGGWEAGQMAKALNDRRIPVLVSLNYPRPDKDVSPEFEVPVRVQRIREHARVGAAEIARAGIKFAFCSDGLATGAEFLANLRLTVKAGLPKDAAIRAATLSAAEILGVDQQLGTVETGKIANLIVADGDLFDDSTQVRSVVVDGQLSAVAAGKKGAGVAALPVPVGTPPPPPHIGTVGTPPREVLIKNATVMTVTHGTIKNGSVLIRDGKIAAVGGGVSGGPQAQVIDARGKWVTPGLIDAHVHYPTDSHNEATSNVTAQTRMQDNLDPTAISAYRALSGGVTTIAALHGSVNPIGGQPAVIKLRWGKTAPEMLFQGARPTQKMALKDYGGSRVGFSPPTSIMGCEAVIRDTLRKAQAYGRQWDDYQKMKAAGVAPLLPPRRDLAMEALLEVLKGQRLVRVHTEGDDERGMLMMMKVAEDFGFRVKTFEHGASAYRVADELARHGASVSIFASLGSDTSYNAAILKSRGVVTSLHSDGELATRYLNQEAAFVANYGAFTENEALALITLNPAKQLEVDKWVGSIDVGKDADLVIWNHQPLSAYAIAETVFI